MGPSEIKLLIGSHTEVKYIPKRVVTAKSCRLGEGTLLSPYRLDSRSPLMDVSLLLTCV